MPRKFTLGYLVETAKRRADMEHQDVVSTAEWYGIASEVFAELHDEIVLGEPRKRQATEVYTTNGSIDYDLPADFLSAVGVYFIRGTDTRRALYKLMPQEQNRFTGIKNSEARAFEFIDDKIRFHPNPPSGQTYELVYVKHPDRLEAQGAGYEIDVVAPAGEKFMIWGMAAIALAKEESFQLAAYCEDKRDKALVRIQEWASEEMITQGNRRINTRDGDDSFDPAEYRRDGR